MRRILESVRRRIRLREELREICRANGDLDGVRIHDREVGNCNRIACEISDRLSIVIVNH